MVPDATIVRVARVHMSEAAQACLRDQIESLQIIAKELKRIGCDMMSFEVADAADTFGLIVEGLEDVLLVARPKAN